MEHKSFALNLLPISRRRFVQGFAVTGAVAGLGLWRSAAYAQDKADSPGLLRGTEFKLDIGATPVNFTGTASVAATVNSQVPAPTLYWREGDTVTLRVTNHLPTVSSIHWHGILLPAAMDGVPGWLQTPMRAIQIPMRKVCTPTRCTAWTWPMPRHGHGRCAFRPSAAG